MNRQELKEREQWLEDQAETLEKVAHLLGKPYEPKMVQTAGEMRREKETLEKQSKKGSAA